MTNMKKTIDSEKVHDCSQNKSADSTDDKSTRKRKLTFTVEKDDAYSFLSFKEEWAPKGRKPGRIDIPLGFLKSQDKTAESKSDNILIPVLPRRYIGILRDQEHIEALRPDGYVYIFMDGFLWRELKVKECGMFSEVNLEAYQGEHQRPATGEKDNRILLPYKSLGKKPKLHICYSEIQWSWWYILRMGGMNPEDHRLKKDKSGKRVAKIPSDIGVSKQNAADLRKKRVEEIDLDSCSKNFQKEAVKDDQVFVQNSKDAPKKVSEEIHRSSEIAHFCMTDSVGIARDLHAEVIRNYEAINTEVLRLKGLYKNGSCVEPKCIYGKALTEYREQHSKYLMAEFIAEYVYMGPDRVKASDAWDKMDDDKKEAIEDRENFQGTKTADIIGKAAVFALSPMAFFASQGGNPIASPYLDRSVLLEFLQFKKIEVLITKVKCAKANLVHWMNDEKEKHRFIASMHDYFSSELVNYEQGLATIRDLIVHLSDHPAGSYAHLLLDYEYFKSLTISNEMSEDFILKLFGQNKWNGKEYPLYRWLFAAAGKDPENILEFTKSTPDKGLPEFNTNLFEKANELDDKDSFQIGRRVFHLFNRIFATSFNQSYLQKSDEILKKKRIAKERKNLSKAKEILEQNIEDSNRKLGKLNGELKGAQANYQQSLDIENRNQAILNRNKSNAFELNQQIDEQMAGANSKESKAARNVSLKKFKSKWGKIQRTVQSELSRQRVLKEALKGVTRGQKSIDKIEQGKITGYSKVKANPHAPVARMMAQLHDLPANMKLKLVDMSVEDLRKGNFTQGIPILSKKSRGSMRKKLREYEDLLEKNLRKVNSRTAKAKVTATMPLGKLTHMDPDALRIVKELCGHYEIDGKTPDSQVKIKVLVLEDQNLANAEKNKTEVDRYISDSDARARTQVTTDASQYKPSKNYKEMIDQLIPEQNSDASTLKRLKATRSRLVSEIQFLDDALQKVDSIKAPASAKAMVQMQGFFALLEVWNFSSACNKYLTTGNKMDAVNAASALVTLAASIGVIREYFLEQKYGGYSEKHVKQLIRLRVYSAAQLRWTLRLTVIFRRIGIVSNIIDGLLEAKSFIEATGKHDWAGALGSALMGIGFGLGIAALCVPVLGWFALVFLLVGAIVKYFSDSALETWMKHCPFGGSKDDAPESLKWTKTNELTYLELMRVLYGEPGCTIKSRVLRRPNRKNYVQYSETDIVIYTPLLLGDNTVDVGIYLAPYGIMDKVNKEYRTENGVKILDLSNLKEFQRIDLEQKSDSKEAGQLGVGLDTIWGDDFVWRENGLDKNLYDGSERAPGYHLRFNGSCFKQAVSNFGTDGITLMVQVQVSPQGKDEKLFPDSSIDFVYPDFGTNSVINNDKVNEAVAYSQDPAKKGLFYFTIVQISPRALISDPKVKVGPAKIRNDRILDGLCSIEKIKVNGGYIPEYCR